MYKSLLTVLLLLITLTLTAQPVSASTTPTAPKAPTIEKKYYGLWQKITLMHLLRQQVSLTPSKAPTPIKSGPTPTITPTPKAGQSAILSTPTPTQKPANPTPTPIKSGPTKTQSPTSVPATSAPAATNDVTAFLMKEINDYRASQGLGSVQTSSETCSFAKIRAQEITTNFNHDGFNNRKNSHTLPYASWTAITENIAMTSNYKDVVTMWKNSSGHAANMRANTPFVCVMQSGNYFAYEGMKP